MDTIIQFYNNGISLAKIKICQKYENGREMNKDSIWLGIPLNNGNYAITFSIHKASIVNEKYAKRRHKFFSTAMGYPSSIFSMEGATS